MPISLNHLYLRKPPGVFMEDLDRYFCVFINLSKCYFENPLRPWPRGPRGGRFVFWCPHQTLFMSHSLCRFSTINPLEELWQNFTHTKGQNCPPSGLQTISDFKKFIMALILLAYPTWRSNVWHYENVTYIFNFWVYYQKFDPKKQFLWEGFLGKNWETVLIPGVQTLDIRKTVPIM